MITPIFTTRKLQKTIPKFVLKEEIEDPKHLGNWHANIFYVNRKRCWLLFNKLTKYFLVFNDVKQADIKNISKVFKQTFYNQLIADDIIVEYSDVENLIGEIKILETDGDRSANASLNIDVPYFEDWRYQFGHYDNMDFRDLNSRLNISPNQMLNWKYPKDEMKDEIYEFIQQINN